MKIILILSITALTNIYAFGQKINENVIPKKASEITVKTNLTQEDNYAMIVNLLTDNHYLIDVTLKDYGIITTNPVKLSSRDEKHYLIIKTEVNAITFSGMYLYGDEYYIQMRYYDHNFREPFDILIDLANQVDFESINYKE